MSVYDFMVFFPLDECDSSGAERERRQTGGEDREHVTFFR